MEFERELLKIQQELKKKELVWCREKLMGWVLEWVELGMIGKASDIDS